MLKRGEALRLTRYRLGDGGWTIGYGRYYPDGGPLPPESISRDTAEAWFADDVEQRGARWVRAYVSVPLLQHQFDALTHIAFNLSPKSFKTIADAVNAGQDPEAAALRFVRAGTNLEAGLRNRRAREIALWRTGIYA
jgi:lysozyme